MRRKPLGIGIGAWAIGLGVYAIALIVTLPATFFDAGLKRASEGRLRVAEAQGSLWSGTGQIEIRDPERHIGIAESLAWRVQPESLLRGKLIYEVRLEQSSRRFRLAISPAQVEVTEADIALPAAVLGLAVPRLAALGLTGDVRLHVASATIGRSGVQGSATVQWLGASSTLTPVSPLGAYELRLETAGGAGQARLRTLEGPLQLDGTGSWTKDGQPALIATARVPPELRSQLAPLLRLTAMERPDGSFELHLVRYPISLPARREN